MLFRRLDRYLFAEIIGPLGLGFLVYTGMLLLRFLFQSAEMIIRRGLPVSVVGELLAFSLPNIVVLTIPMALLFGILIALGRLASDSELVAMRSCGMSLTSLYRPVLLLSLLLTVVNTLLMVYVLPPGNHALQQLRVRIITETVAKQVETRVFYPEFEGSLLYVFENPPGDDRWQGVFLAQAVPSTQKNQISVADFGRIKLDDDGERVLLELENAVTHEIDLDAPDRYEISLNRRAERLLEDRFTSSQRERISRSKSLRELNIPELRDRLRSADLGAEQRNLARVEIHKKFSIPAACLVFGLFALPLGFNNRRGGKGAGFAISLGVFLLYYVILNNGENAARYGKMAPWLAMWMPNFLLSAAGLVLLARRNRDKSLLISRLDRWVREDLWNGLLLFRGWRDERGRRRRERRRLRSIEAHPAGAAETHGRPELVLRLPRLRLHVSTILDRYIVRAFGGVLVLVTLSAMTLYIIADLGEHIDEIIKNQVPQAVVLHYYQYMSLQMFYELAPLLVLLTTLITFSVLARSNEITACKSLGLSLYRLALPALAAAALVSLFCVFLQSEVLPASNQRASQLEDRIRGRETSRTFRRADRQWLFGQGRFVYNYLHYDPDEQALQRLQIFEFDDDHRLVSRLFARRASYNENGSWVFEDGWVRHFEGVEVTDYTRFREPRLVDYPETPEYFDAEIRAPEQMRFGELREYIQELEESGQAVPELRVQLHNKLAYPVISIVMALVALPFAFRLGRQGALYGLGISIVLGLVFVAIFALFTALGEAAALPAALAVWSPNVLFSMFAGYLFLGVRT